MWFKQCDVETSAQVHLIYATEGSTARRLAEDVAYRLYQHNVTYLIKNFDDCTEKDFYEVTSCVHKSQDLTPTNTQNGSGGTSGMSMPKLGPPLLLFFVSTSGQGEFPIKAQNTVSMLQQKLAAQKLLQNTRFSVFGIGDAKYPKFNFAAKALYRLVKALGATVAVPPALGSESSDLGAIGELEDWTQQILAFLGSPKPIEPAMEVDLPISSTIPDDSPEEAFPSFDNATLAVSSSLTGGTRCRHFSFRLDRSFNLGDEISIQPLNITDQCGSFFASFTVDLDRCPSVGDLAEYAKTLRKCDDLEKRFLLCRNRSYRRLFTEILDVSAIPSRAWLAGLASVLWENKHRDKLLEIAQHDLEGVLLYREYIIEEKRSIADVIRDFSLGFDDRDGEVLTYCVLSVPLTAPRRYTIANSPKWYSFVRERVRLERKGVVEATDMARKIAATQSCEGENMVDVCLAIKQTVTPHMRKIMGLCSSYLMSLQVGDTVKVRIEPNRYLPEKELLSRSGIYIGTGAGVAPLRAIAQHVWLMQDSIERASRHRFYVGLRHPILDELYESDFALVESFANIIVCRALSRGEKRQRVQDLLRRDGEIVANLLLDSSSVVYLAGRSHPMPGEIMQAFHDVLAEFVAESDSNIVLQGKQRRGQYIEDTWGE